MTLFLNLLFELDSYSNEYLPVKIGVDTAENEPLKFHSNFVNFNAMGFHFHRAAPPDLTSWLLIVCEELLLKILEALRRPRAQELSDSSTV